VSALILAAIKPLLTELIAKAKAGAPALIDAAVAWAIGMLPGTIDKLTVAFRQVYGDITGRLVAWLPSTRAPLAAGVNRLLDLVSTKVIAKL
jgi:hypothetical protein